MWLKLSTDKDEKYASFVSRDDNDNNDQDGNNSNSRLVGMDVETDIGNAANNNNNEEQDNNKDDTINMDMHHNNNNNNDKTTDAWFTYNQGNMTTCRLSPQDWQEVLFCFAFYVFAFWCHSHGPFPVRQRPIPHQVLQNSGDIVRNLTHDEQLNHSQTIPKALPLAFYFPITAQCLLAFLYGKRGDRQAALCVYFVAFGITFLATDMLKAYVGYLRPIFYQLCQPDENYEYCTAQGASNSMRLSFPSGHASESFCGLTLLALFLHTRFGIPSVKKTIQKLPDGTVAIRPAGPCHRPRLLSILSLLPLALACFVASSRIVDNKHFPADVVGGALLGASVANFVHGLWFMP